MKAYVVGCYTVQDLPVYMEYLKNVRDTIVLYGGRTLVADHEHRILEGDAAPVVVIVEFESAEKTKEWYYSTEYQNVINFRKNSTAGWVTLCNELSIPEGWKPE